MRPNVHIVRTDLVPRGYDAITFWTWILVRRTIHLDEELLAHELMHVRQWKRYGPFGFLWRYGWTWVRDGFSYERIDLEEEAYAPTPDARAWARSLLDAEQA